MSALKRGTITARIGQSENHSLPSQNEANRSLTTKSDEKRKRLDNLCETLRVLQLQNKKAAEEERVLLEEKNSLKNLRDNIMKETTGLEAMVTQMKSVEDSSFHEKHQTIKMHEEHGLEKQKLEKELEKKTEILEGLREKQASYDQRRLEHREKLAAQEMALEYIEDTITKDERTTQDLESHLSRLARRVFENQRRLENLQTSANTSRNDLLTIEKRMRKEKEQQFLMRTKLNEEMKKQDRKQQHRQVQSTAEQKRTNESVLAALTKKLEQLKATVDDTEKSWIEHQQQINETEEALAKAESEVTTATQLKNVNEAKLEMIRLQPITPMYRSFASSSQLSNRTVMEKANGGEFEQEKHAEKQQLERLKSSLSGIPESMQSLRLETTRAEKKYLASTGSSSKSTSSLGKYSEVQERDRRRKKFVHQAEQDANIILATEHKQLVVSVGELSKECDQKSENNRKVRELSEAKLQEKQAYEERVGVVKQRMMEEREERLSEQKKLEVAYRKEANDATTEISRLQEQKALLEHQRNMRKQEANDLNLEKSILSHKYKTMLSWKKKVDQKAISELSTQIAELKEEVEKAEREDEALSEMVEQARQANSLVKNELRVLKPYDNDYRQHESLLDLDRRLSRQIGLARNQNTARRWLSDGNLKVGRDGSSSRQQN